MPDTLTHAFMAEDVFVKLDSNLKELIDLDIFKLAAQGPDPYFYHNVLPNSKGVSMAWFGGHMHRNKTREYFITLIKYIKEKELYDDKQVMAFLYGFICHYALDTTAHPYIFYKTGEYIKDDPNTHKYLGLHMKMERWIDGYLINNRHNVHPKKFKHYDYLLNLNLSNSLINTLNDVLVNVYEVDNMGDTYKESVKQMYSAFKHMAYDRVGIKKGLYYFLSNIYKPMSKFRYLSSNVNPNQNLDYLNYDKKEWVNPCDENIKANFSFIELYDISINEAIKMINEVNSYFNDQTIDLSTIFTNKSYENGLDCTLDLDMKYFDF